MGWLAAGVLYAVAYAVVGQRLSDDPTHLSWFRAVALGVPPLAGATVIAGRRGHWRGHWLFWSTMGVGLGLSAIGLTGWAAEEFVSQRQAWLAWPAVFTLFGGIAPLLALLAQPHKGVREPLAATTAVDIAGLAVVTGFFYSFFVTIPDIGPPIETGARSLRLVSELQQALVAVG
jgi:hypothetical protein